MNVWEGAEGELKDCADIMEKTIKQKDTLRKEVEKYCKERGVEVK